MLFVRKTTTPVVVESDPAARAQAAMLAEDRGRASGTVAALGIIAIVALLFLVGYFAWWAPINAAQAESTTQPVNETRIIERQTPAPPTIIQTPPVTPAPANPPTVIERDRIVTVPVPVPTPSQNDDTTVDPDEAGGAFQTTGGGGQ